MLIYGNAQKPKRKVCFKSITLRKKCPYSEFLQHERFNELKDNYESLEEHL